MINGFRFTIQNKNDDKFKNFLRENSYYYKYLNRSSSYLQDVIEDMKDKYGMRPSDKINKMINNIGLINSFLEALR